MIYDLANKMQKIVSKFLGFMFQVADKMQRGLKG